MINRVVLTIKRSVNDISQHIRGTVMTKAHHMSHFHIKAPRRLYENA